MDLIFENPLAGTTRADSDSGAEVAAKINQNFENIAGKFRDLEERPNGTEICNILDAGMELSVNDNAVDIPGATREKLGLVKGGAAENGVEINEDFTITVHNLNVDRLVQTAGENLVLNGGDT